MEKVIVALDAMGGDHAPAETVKGAVNAVNSSDEIKVILVGRETQIKEELSKYEYDENKIEIVNATEIINMGMCRHQRSRIKKILLS